MGDPQPGDDLSDWQLEIAIHVARWAPFGVEALGLTLAIAGIAWAIAGGLQHYWTGALKIVCGLVAGRTAWRFADLTHMLALEIHDTYSFVLEGRQRATDTRGYFLFLRSFRDQAFARQHTISVSAPDASNTTIEVDNLSDLLEQSLERHGRVIMIGHESSANPFVDTSVMVQTDDANWWDTFTRLLANARGVFLVPGSSVGLLREFTEVLQGPHRTKALVVMPRIDAQGLRADRWERLRGELAQRGFDVPPYDPVGCFYLPDAHLRPMSVYSFGHSFSSRAGMRRAFHAVEANLPRGTTPFKDALTWVTLASGRLPVNLHEYVNRQDR